MHVAPCLCCSAGECLLQAPPGAGPLLPMSEVQLKFIFHTNELTEPRSKWRETELNRSGTEWDQAETSLNIINNENLE